MSKKLIYDVMRSASVTASYAALSTPLGYAASIVKLVNRSTGDVFISTNGVDDHDIAPANGFWLYDETSNSPHEDNVYDAAGTQYYIKGAGTGTVYLVIKYNKITQQS
jgi:hypothetical protein